MIYIIVVLHGVVFLSIIPKRYWSLILLEMPLVFLVSGYTFALT